MAQIPVSNCCGARLLETQPIRCQACRRPCTTVYRTFTPRIGRACHYAQATAWGRFISACGRTGGDRTRERHRVTCLVCRRTLVFRNATP